MRIPRSARRVMHPSPLEEVNHVSFTYTCMFSYADPFCSVLQLVPEGVDSLSRGTLSRSDDNERHPIFLFSMS